MIINPLTLPDLFSADFRNNEVREYGYSEAEFIQVRDFEDEALHGDHDCSMSLKGSCLGCEYVREVLG